jgi:hypothetical protein
MVGGLVGAPLILPWLVIGIAALLFFAQLQKVLPFFHLSLRTVVATQVVCTFPLVTAIVSAQLLRFERTQEEAAIDLGASRLQVLRYVMLPHIMPALAAAGIPKAHSKEARRNYYARSAKIKIYVLKRAKGLCEACKREAPFLRKNGSPYLEPHHIRRIADGGPDHPKFVAAQR